MAALDVRRPVGRYADGAEAELLAVMEAAGDRSSTSEELRAAIHDWPTEYHLSPVRANLLRPLRLAPGSRVLEVGAGTGVLTRWLGEQGHAVVAVEGALARAEVAAARCADLDGVQVICGGADEVDPEVDGRFDAVLLIGVVEYGGVGGLPQPADLLASCARLLAPGGVLVLAIENQLGVQYLSGAPEDHWLQPGVGVEGYLRPGARTWHRRALTELLAGAGLAELRWLYPFPDYKLPVAVLGEGAYRRLPAAVVDGLARRVRATHHPAWPSPWDVGLGHTTLVGAGVGPEVANSFLVVAGRGGAEVDEVVDGRVLAWLEGHGRRPRWWRRRAVVATPDGLVVRTEGGPGVGAGGAGPDGGWLAQRAAATEPFLPAPDLARTAFEACAAGDGDALDAVLGRWRAAVDQAAVAVGGPGDAGVAHPFRPAGATRLLAADRLDVDLGNFVPAPDGALAYVDDEWVAAGPVDRDVVAVRALWNLARHHVARGVAFPGQPSTPVDELARLLAERAGLDLRPGALADWHRAERQLQDLVVGSTPEQAESWLDGSLTVAALAAAGGGPATRHQEALVAMSALAEERLVALGMVQAELGQARGELADAREALAQRHAEPARRPLARVVRKARALLRRLVSGRPAG